MTETHVPWRYVRSLREAEELAARDPRVVIAMRRGALREQLAAHALVDLYRRGYRIGWDSLVGYYVATSFHVKGAPRGVLRVPTVDEVVDRLIHAGHAVPEPERGALVDQWALPASTMGDGWADERDLKWRFRRTQRWWGMQNRAMRDKLERGECVDVAKWGRTAEGHYVIPSDVWQEDVDYCNGEPGVEQWIHSIGRGKATGVIVASHSNEFYQHLDFDCLWLR